MVSSRNAKAIAAAVDAQNKREAELEQLQDIMYKLDDQRRKMQAELDTVEGKLRAVTQQHTIGTRIFRKEQAALSKLRRL